MCLLLLLRLSPLDKCEFKALQLFIIIITCVYVVGSFVCFIHFRCHYIVEIYLWRKLNILMRFERDRMKVEIRGNTHSKYVYFRSSLCHLSTWIAATVLTSFRNTFLSACLTPIVHLLFVILRMRNPCSYKKSPVFFYCLSGDPFWPFS